MKSSVATVLVALVLGTGFGFAETPPSAPAVPAEQPLAPAEPPPAANILPAQPSDPFGEEVTFDERRMLSVKGGAGWENGFEALQQALKTVTAALGGRKLAAAGNPLVVYLRADDAGFDFEAGLPVADAPETAENGDLGVRKTPSGRALRFTHRGSFDTMDRTYEAMTNYLDEKRIDVTDVYIEEYVTDPLTTPEDELRVFIYVFPK
ncbi:MAG: GyrI-like domain-containing protein [Bacteroidales bacterium]|nr:GyrI-like domain-containing protein [Bacteroidales bacterium]